MEYPFSVSAPYGIATAYSSSLNNLQFKLEQLKLPKEESESSVNIKDYLDDGKPELIRLIQTEWKNIRTNYNRGKITNTYNFRLRGDKEINDLLWKVFFDQKSPFRINLNFSFILKNKLNNDLHFWKNQANAGLLNQSILITSHSDFKEFMKNFSKIDYVKKLFAKRPNTRWLFYRI